MRSRQKAGAGDPARIRTIMLPGPCKVHHGSTGDRCCAPAACQPLIRRTARDASTSDRSALRTAPSPAQRSHRSSAPPRPEMLLTVAGDSWCTGTHVCSMFARMSRYGPVAGGITRHRVSRLPHRPAGHSISRHYLTRFKSTTSRLLICGFGVQVPGGAPILTWGFTGPGPSFRARFVPILPALAPGLLGDRMFTGRARGQLV